jgi:hypothetical protein
MELIHAYGVFFAGTASIGLLSIAVCLWAARAHRLSAEPAAVST